MKERTLLIVSLRLIEILPCYVAFGGVIFGSKWWIKLFDMPPEAAIADVDSITRFLSCIFSGVLIWAFVIVGRFEEHMRTFVVLAVIIGIGGLARIASMIIYGGLPGTINIIVTLIELIAPLLVLWMFRIKKKAHAAALA